MRLINNCSLKMDDSNIHTWENNNKIAQHWKLTSLKEGGYLRNKKQNISVIIK